MSRTWTADRGKTFERQYLTNPKRLRDLWVIIREVDCSYLPLTVRIIRRQLFIMHFAAEFRLSISTFVGTKA